jgi:ATP-dependent Clp protease ATP-binding subunit ClpC
MLILIPIYIETTRASLTNAASQALVQPLFFGTPIQRAVSVERALAALQTELQQKLLGLARAPDHHDLVPWLDVPDYQSHRLRLRVHDGQREWVGEFIWISYRALDRLLLFTPKLAHAHVEIDSLEHMTERLSQVVSQWLKQARKSAVAASSELHAQPNKLLEFADLAIPENTQVRLSLLELDINPTQASVKVRKQDRAGMGGDDRQPDGAQELTKVGRLLNAQHLENMPRGIGIEADVALLLRAWQNRKRQATLLLGKSGVGKTMLIYEALRQIKAEAAVRDSKQNWEEPPRIWLVSPQRLISGMSYLGEWEARLLAILKHAENRNLILYFDDVLALFSAGKHSGSDLTVGDLLLPWLEKRQVRVLAEMTPESWRVLRERRRDFADLWQVQPIQPLPDAKRWSVLAALTRKLAIAHNIQFDLHAVPCAVELCTRYAGEREFPGNVAEQLRQLAARAAPASRITRDDVIADFSRRLGLSLALLDARKTLLESDIETELRKHLKGQNAAISALTEAVLRCKTGLNDPKRPLAVLLLLGPTGVGKTQCAKALARLVSPHLDALIRIDLNEYTDVGDAARLIGTWAQPDGVLTSAIRRQPTAVVLFDEIEKANPEVFDVLLSLLDEGRLSDAHGRVADFTRAFILLTSNLGAREAQVQLGFTATAHAQNQYREAAKKFFRPEFFNRLDDIIGFRPFNDTELREITTALIQQALSRAGIRARHCLVALEPSAIGALQQFGQDPNLGARAIKRGIERALMQPLARYLSVLNVRQPLRIILSGANDTLSIALEEFSFAARTGPDLRGVEHVHDLDDVLSVIAQLLDQQSARLDAMIDVGSIALSAISAQAQHYFACREQLGFAQRLLDKLRRSSAQKPLGKPHKMVQARRSNARADHAGSAAHAKQGVDLSLHLAELDSADVEAQVSLSRETQQLHETLRKLLGAISWLTLLLDADAVVETRYLRWKTLPDTVGVIGIEAVELLLVGDALSLLPGCQHVELLDHDVQSYRHDGTPATLKITGFGIGALCQAEQGWTLEVGQSGLALSGIAVSAVVGEITAQLPNSIIRKKSLQAVTDLRTGLKLSSQCKTLERLDFWLAHLPLPDPLAQALRALTAQTEATL